MELIKIEQDHYIIVDDSEIREGDWYIDDTKSIRQSITSDQSYWSKRKEYKKITHSTQPLEYSSKIGKYWGKVMPLTLTIPEIKELIGEVDVEKKSYDILKGFVITKDERRYFELGYTKALEDNKEKKYTKEDLIKAIFLYAAWITGGSPSLRIAETAGQRIEQIIKSLQPKTEWEVEFVDGKLALKK